MASSTDTNTTNCASCGKEGGNLNTCNKCNMVKYCNAACKKKHRSRHKKACERRVAELHDEELFKEPPPRDDCPICFLPLPLDARQSAFHSCCGKIICGGCIYAMMGEELGRGGEVGGEVDICAFCRALPATSDAETTKRLKKLIDANNADAFYLLAGCYEHGIKGMPQDWTKANELYLRAGELGCAEGYYNLGNSYNDGRGVEVDNKKAKHYWELAAMNGNVVARYNLGCVENEAGNIARAMKHLMLSARAGYKMSLDAVKEGFIAGYVTKDEYANSLYANQSQQDEMKSDTRDSVRAVTNS